jgi:hypothetical protein
MPRIVEIPDSFLLTIAVYGNMGDGDLPDIMRIWAQKECRRLGLQEEMIKLQKYRLRELEIKIRNVMGDDAIDKLGNDIKKVAKAINKVIRE